MASIIVDLSDDIKKLQSLKAEIQEVKKELGSINVNVHLDIKRDMEAKLKSLTSQYDALVQKVSEAEGKVIASTQRINQAAEKIIKAQEQLAKATGAQPQTGNASSGANAAAANAETASVQAQAKAYDELTDEIDAVMGTRTQNIRRMIEEQNAIRIINEELKRMQKLNQSGVYSQSEIKRMEQLNASLLQHKTALSELRQSLNNSFKLDNAAATSMNALSQSLARMRMTYRELTEEERNSPFGKELLSSIQQADAKIKQLDATIGNHQRNVGNYASGWNGLSMSIQQIGRELPSLAVGWSTFFLAISNNLPILSDELARARKEYNELKAAGQQATPVWKQVVSSLLSWQTALTVGITLLTLYGKDIIEWVGNLFKAKDGTAELEAATKRLNTTVSEVYGSISEEMRNLRSLNDALQNAKRGTDEWESIRQKIVAGYSKYLPSIDSEIEKTGTLAGSYDKLAESIQRAAAARGFEKYSAEEDEKYFEERNKQLERVYDAFIDQLGNDEGLKQYQKWLRLLDSGEGLSRKQQGEFGQIDVGWWLGNANSVLFELRKAQEAHDKALERYREIFNISEGAETALPPDSIKAMRESIAARREALEQMSVESKEYAKLKAQIEADEKKLEKLTQKQEKTNKEAEKRKESQQKLSDKLLSLQEKNQQDEIALMKDGTDKKLKQIDADYEAQRNAIAKQSRDWAKENKRAGASDLNANGLTKDQQAEIDRANILNNESRIKRTDEVYKAEREAMRDYLKEYGTFQQQKLAIAQEYAEKIAKAQSEGERMALERQRDKAISQVNANALKMDIDWATAFSGLDGVFSEVIKPVLDKVKEYAKTEEFRGLDASDQQSIIDAISRMEESVGGLGDVKFSDLGKSVKSLQQSILDLNDAKIQEVEAIENLQKAQEDYENALKNGTQEQADIAKLTLDDAQNKADAASKNVEAQQKIVKDSSNNLNSTVTTLDAKLKNVTQGFQQLSSGGLSNLYQGITKLVKGFGGTAEKLGDIEFVGAIFSALDALKGGIVPIAEEVIGDVFGVLNNTVSDIFSGDIFVSLFDSLRDGIGGFFDAITFGGFSSWFSSSNAKEVQATIDRLTDRNEALQSSIDTLNDTMKQARGTETVQAAKQSEEYQKEVNRNYLEMAMAQAGYHGSHHSWNYYWGGFSQEQIDKLSEQIGREWSGSLWDLSPEEMKVLKGNVDMWEQIQNTGKGGYGGRLTERLDDYIDQAGKLEEITETLRESLTQISFDSMYDSFIDSLMDMEYSAEDAADNIAEYFMRAMLSNQIGEMYADKLKEWYAKFADAMNDGALDDNEITGLRDEYLGYVEDALKLRDELAAATGYDKINDKTQKQQSASSGSYETMTQDQATELSGRFTAVAESNYRIEGAITQLSGSVSVLTASVTGVHDIADETRSILANSYLELQQINENTAAIIVPIQKMQKDMEIVKQNTSRL